MSTTRTRFPSWKRHMPRLVVVAVLPTPPFWFATEITFAAILRQSSEGRNGHAIENGLRVSLHEDLAALLRKHNLRLLELSARTATAEQAAEAVGCAVAQIVKSLLLVAGGSPLMVLAAGDRRVDLKRLAALSAASEVRMATPAEVRETTGFAIGGVPPFGHARRSQTLIDSRLLPHGVVYAAAGTPHRVFAIDPDLLRRLSEATTADL